MSVTASLLILQFACALGARLTDISHGARIADPCTIWLDQSRVEETLLHGVDFIPVPHIDDDVQNAPWFIDDFPCREDADECFHNKNGHYTAVEINTETLKVTEDGLVIQPAARVPASFFPNGNARECVRISSSPKCEDEGESVDAQERLETDDFNVLKSKSKITLKHQAIPDGDHAVGNWSGDVWYNDALQTYSTTLFTISAPAKEGEAPKFSLTRGNESDQQNQWYGDLGEPDERQIRWVTLSGPYTPAAGDRNFGVRQLTGNSMEYFGGEGFAKARFAVREYETTIPLMTSAFLCARSTTSSPWVPVKGFTWNYYQLETSPDPSPYQILNLTWTWHEEKALEWHSNFLNGILEVGYHSRTWYHDITTTTTTAPATTTSLSPSTTTLASTMHLGATLLAVVNVIGSSH